MAFEDRYAWLRKEADIESLRVKIVELEDLVNSLKDRIVNLKMENAYLRGFIDGDPKNKVTIEKNFFS